MSKQKKIAFYVFGMTQLQDLLPVYLCFKKNNYNPWICFLDCLERKRQLRYYEGQELKSFIEDVCEKNNLSPPEVDYFGQSDQGKFEKKYSQQAPDVVVLQGCSHKYIRWIPKASDSKVINMSYHFDVNEKSSLYKIDYNIVTQEKYLDLYKDFRFESRYFGDVKMDHCHYLETPTSNFSIPNKEKICFIAETHLRIKSDGSILMSASKTPYEEKVFKNDNSLQFVSKMLDFLKAQGFYVVWKEREKGFPKGVAGGWDNILNHIESKPDLVIERDLNFPSSLIYLPFISDVSLTLNISTTTQIIRSLTNKIVNVHTDEDFARQMEKVLESSSDRKVLSYTKPNVSEEIFNFIVNEV